MIPKSSRVLAACTVGAALLLASAGAATAQPAAAQPAAVSPSARPAHDPFETFNRAVFEFNDGLDRALLKPAAQAYVFVVPEVLRFVVSNVFANLGDVWVGVNNLLQGKPMAAGSDFLRFGLNSTLGFAGFADIASEIGLRRNREDFGQTLGWWGLPAGPYLVLPVFGPSSVRDTAGFAVDTSVDYLWRVSDDDVRFGAAMLRLVNIRASLLEAERVIDAAAIDRYSFIRDGYLQRRRNLVYDGDPPPEPAEPVNR